MAEKHVANKRQQITLSRSDWALFNRALINPPARHAKLQEALMLHKRMDVCGKTSPGNFTQ